MSRIITAIAFFSCTFSAISQIWDFDAVQRIPGTINTEKEESIPVFSPDSSMLYFIRSMDESNKGGKFDQDIWVAKRQSDGSYSECSQLSSLNSKYNNGVVGISKSGSVLYLLDTYDGKKDLVKGIASAERKGDSWSTPERINVPTLDIEGDYYGFHVSDDQTVMLISYKGPGTVGDEDLYVSLKSGDSWSAPVNLGSDINTAGFEMSPFLSKNKDTLFFSSNGHGGLGDADIFYAVRKDLSVWTSWKKPVNLGAKINSSKFDACFSYNGNRLYWASNRDGELSDIYTALFVYPPPMELSCEAIAATKHEGSDGSVTTSLKGGAAPYTYSWSNNSTEKDLFNVPKGEYTLTVTDSRGKTISTSCLVDEPAPLELPVITATTFKNLEFMNYFNYNKNKLVVDKGDLKKFVKDVEKQLKDGRPSITINVYSSASKVPTKTYETNEKLAQIRAENMKYDLSTYFESKVEFRGKVNVVIVSAIVDGPDYVEDFKDLKKYRPYQFVGLKTE